ncbi:MAG: hypothetical protein LUD74_01325, partial [Tannerellaceae bacterium]|nr:hypothetical protein [Tannerellaceae bacterium]
MWKKYSFYTLLLLLLTTCTLVDDPSNAYPMGGSDFLLKMALHTPAGEEFQTPDSENNVLTLFILFFEPSSDQSGKLLNIYNDTLKTEAPATLKEIPVRLNKTVYNNLEASGEYNLLITANTEYYTRATSYDGSMQNMDQLREYFLTLWEGMSEKQIAEGAFLRLENKNIKPGHLPMSGKAVKRAGSDEVNVELTRCVSRLEIVNEDSRYELVSAAVWNVLGRTTVWDKNFAGSPDDAYFRLPEVNAAPGTNRITTGLYALENQVSAPLQNDTITTCLIIGLRRTDNQRLEYFRLNVHPAERMQQLKRNNIYRFTIRKVLGDGERIAQEAYLHGAPLLDGNINKWEKENFGGIVFDENNILAVSFANIYFRPEGGTATIDIFTQGPGELAILDDLPYGMTAETIGNRIFVNAPGSREDREGEITITLGQLRLTVNVQQGGSMQEELLLSRDTIGVFPAAINGEKPLAANPVKVTTKPGNTWTARLYNNPKNETGRSKFSFGQTPDGKQILEYKAGNPEELLPVSVNYSNTTREAVYSFIMISLDDNPAVSRVLLLTQRTGEISLSSNFIEFTPGGYKPGSNPAIHYQDIEVETEYDVWRVRPMQGESDAFTWQLLRAAGEESEKKSILRIAATQNETGKDKEITLRIFIEDYKDESLFEDLRVRQASHHLTLLPHIPEMIVDAAGGYSEWITVNTTGPWTATLNITPNDYKMTLIKENGNISQEYGNTIQGASGEKFRIYFPENTT